MHKRLGSDIGNLQRSILGLALTCTLSTGCAGISSDSQRKNSKQDPANQGNTQKLPDGNKLPDGLSVAPNFTFSDVPYLATSTADVAAIKARVDDANALHFTLAKLIANKSAQENIVFSAYSIQTAFALLYPATAEGSVSAQEIAQSMRFNGKTDDFHQAMLAQQIAVENAFTGAKSEEKLEYNLVNQVWTDTSLGLQKEYTDILKRYYNAGIGQLPFRTAPDDSRKTINSFVEANTNGLIKDLLPADSIKDDTVTVLTNSIYMLANWAQPFKKSASVASNFTNLDGSTSQPITMRQTSKMSYTETADYQAVSMDYVGNKLAMLIVLPKAGSDFIDFASSFDQAAFRSTIDGLSRAEVIIGLPKFEFTWKSAFKDHLKQLGMAKVFEFDRENFPKMWTENNQPITLNAKIDDVYHQAKIIVDEAGTEAAAATAIVMQAKSDSKIQRQIEFKVDRPALFYIYEKANGSILFGGQIVHF